MVPTASQPTLALSEVEDLAPGADKPMSLTTISAHLPVYPQNFGAKCDGSNDDAAAYRAAARFAMASGRPLHVGGANLCVIGSSIHVAGSMTIEGDGEGKSILVGTFNGPIFVWTATGSEVARSSVSDFTIRGQFPPNAEYTRSRGFVIQGDNTSFFQYNRFTRLTFESLYAAFDVQKASFTTSFGQESTVAWLNFNDITIRSGSRHAIYGWLWNYGSGTGTTYSNIKTAFTTPDAAAFYYKAGVVGDIVINGGHFGGNGSTLIKVDGATNYRNNILVAGSQLDAGMSVPFKFQPNSPTYQRISFTGNNLGGGVVLSMPPVADSLIDDQLADQRRAGKNFSTGDAGRRHNVPLFSVILDSLSPFTGTECTVVVAGLVGGIGGGAARATYLIGRNGTDPVVTLIGSPVATNGAPQFFSITPIVVAGTGQVNIVTSFTPTAANSNLDAQIRCMGGTYAVGRL
ncbi:hypothetical protein SAMN02799642_05489 [Methylobacterium brachiatum]|nr:hypothetical protein SAMN02799642_05489 [Methylobacterium brachiatum]